MLKKYKAIFFDWDGTAVMSSRSGSCSDAPSVTKRDKINHC